jgi:hypothetical protein
MTSTSKQCEQLAPVRRASLGQLRAADTRHRGSSPLETGEASPKKWLLTLPGARFH